MQRDGTIISYNGEVYNYKEIRLELESLGYVFTSIGDTEVVLYAWQEWGDLAFEKFDGMFVIAIFDGEVLTISSDRFGEKTLYYAITGNAIYISSELSTLVKELSLPPNNSKEIDTLFMLYGYIPGPKTYYKNTYKLQPAEVIKIKSGSILSKHTYWTLPSYKKTHGIVKRPSKNDLSIIRNALIESLEMRLHADVPMCLFLSGGVDSALVASILKFELNKNIDCVTVAFKGNDSLDESSQALEVSNFLGLSHEIVNVDSSHHTDIVKEVINMFGQPFETTTSLIVRDMTAAVSDKYKVGLTGFGADEVFSGYGKHAYAYKYRKFLNANNFFRFLVKYIARYLILDRGGRLSNWSHSMLGVDFNERYFAIKLFPTIRELRKLPEYWNIVNSTFFSYKDIVRLVYKFELMNALPDSRCVSNDLGSMNSSFELRTPFLSKKIVEATNKIDYRKFVAFGQKEILRSLLKEYLPDSLVDRPKRGFSIPNEWVLSGVKKNSKYNGSGDNWDKLKVRSEILRRYHCDV